MQCCHCQGIESLFSEKAARRELRSYRRKGPTKSTRALLAALESAGVRGRSLLDIGGGVGAIQHELMRAGASGVTNVIPSPSPAASIISVVSPVKVILNTLLLVNPET